jgi:hypothetical protein
MEECEALCTKLGIMVNGQFQCFGNIQHLKNKYGNGYSLIIKCKFYHEFDNFSLQKNQLIIDNVEKFINDNIQNAQLKDKQQQTLFYQIFNLNENNDNRNGQQITIARIFELIETNKDVLNIETYSLSQTTLDQIFLSFASKQHSLENHNNYSSQSNMFNINEVNETDNNYNNDEVNHQVAFNQKNLITNNGNNNRRKFFSFNNLGLSVSSLNRNNLITNGSSASNSLSIALKEL